MPIAGFTLQEEVKQTTTEGFRRILKVGVGVVS
jgi:hypothetical protein